MANLREYRRDQERISKTLLQRKNIRSQEEFDREYNKYMKGSQQDPNFREGVSKSVQSKQRLKFKKTIRKTRVSADNNFNFAGTQKGKKAIQKARFDKKVKRYRNEKGQFVKKV